MEFNFKIKDDLLIPSGIFRAASGSVNAYTCRFLIAEPKDNLLWICVFKRGDKAYQQVIENGKCTVPAEVLFDEGTIYIGCYATTETGEFVRISTNWVPITVGRGAYCDATAPEVPTPDVWEELVIKKLPYIGENGNWFVYSPNGAYTDSGVAAEGFTPQKGVDYWTKEDIAKLEDDIKEELLDGLTFSVAEDGTVTVEKED